MHTLTSSDLNIINHLSETNNDNSQRFESEVQLAKHLKIELIDKPTFDYKHAHKISYFIADTTEIKKVDGVIILKTKENDIKLEDRPTEEENEIFHFYLGQYSALDKYVVSSHGWE